MTGVPQAPGWWMLTVDVGINPEHGLSDAAVQLAAVGNTPARRVAFVVSTEAMCLLGLAVGGEVIGPFPH